MAENKNLDELNMLQNDGKIDSTQARQEDRKDVEAVARGKKTIEDAPQAVTVELLKEYSNQNKVFAKLEAHCDQDGVDIYAYFMRCFRDNETVRVSDILDDIAKRIPTLIDVINDDKNNNLFIDGNGNIDVAGSLKKARDNGRELPSYIQAIAEDAGKDNKKEEVIPKSIMEYLSKKDDDFFKTVSDNLNKGLGKSIDNLLNSVKDANGNNDAPTVNIGGSDVSYHEKLSKEDNILLNKLIMMKGLLENNEKLSHAEAPEYIAKLVILYRECAKMDISKSAIPNIKENLQDFMNDISEAFKALSNGLDVKALIEDEDWMKNLQEQIGIASQSIEELESGLLKDLNENVEVLTEKAKELLETMKKTRTENTTAENKSNNKLLIYAILENLEEDEKDGFVATYFSEGKSKKRRTDLVDETLKSTGENYVDEARKTGLYRRIKLNVNTDIYLDILKRERFKQSLNNFRNPRENQNVVNIQESVREMPVFLLALDMIDGDKSVGYTEEDIAAKEEAIKFMKEKFPEAFLDDTIDTKKLFELACEKYNIKHPKVTNFEELFEYAQKYNDNTIRTELTYALKYDAENVDLTDAEIFSLDKITQVLTDEKNLEEVRRKVRSHRSMAFDNRVVDEIENGFMELYNARNNEDFSDVDRRELVKKCLIMVDRLPTHYKERMMNPENCDLAKKVLMEFIPEAFSIAGNIGSQKSRDAILEYFKNHGEEISLKGELPVGIILLESLRKKVAREKIDYSPEEIKKRAEEVKNKKEYISKKISIDVDIKVLKYIKLLREQGLEGKTVEELDKLEQVILGRIERKNPEKNFLKQVSDEVNNMPKNDVLSSQMARTTRRIAASERITALKELHKDGSKLSNEELKEVFDICAGLRNDYSGENIDTKDYKKLMLQISCYILKKNGYDFIDKSKIDDEKFLHAYNKLFGTEITDINGLCDKKASELIEKGISQAISDIDGGKKGLINSQLLDEVAKDNFEPKQKLADYRNQRTTLDVKDIVFISEEMLELKKINDTRGLDKAEKYQYVSGLVVLAKILRDRDIANKFTDARYTEFKELNQKLSVLVKNELQEIMPEVFTTESGHLNMYNLNSRFMDFLQDYNVPVPSDTKGQENFLTELTRRLKAGIKSDHRYTETVIPLNDRVDNITAKLDEVLLGTKEEKSSASYISTFAVVKAMEERRKIPNLTDKLFRNIEKENPELYERIENKAADVSIDDVAMYRMAMITGGDIMAGHQQKIKQAKYVSDTGIAELSDEDKVSMMLNAIGIIESLKQPGIVMNESEHICMRNAKKVLKDICPDVIEDGMHIDEQKLLTTYNTINGSGPKYVTIEELKDNAVNQLLVKTAQEITNKRTINSRYTGVLKKHSSIRGKDDLTNVPISTIEMDKVYEQQAEEIIVDPEVPQIVDDKKKTDIQEEEISSVEVGAYFEAEAVEIGEEEIKKVDQHVGENVTGMHAENIDIADESWRENLPATQKEKGFLGNLFEKFKQGLKTVKDKIFGGTNNTGTTDNNTSTTSGTGGIAQDETAKPVQQVGQPSNDWVQSATISVEDAHKKLNESKGERKIDESEGPTM